MEYIVSLLVRNEVGVLSRVANLFGKRGLNINSISAGETENPCVTRMTIRTEGNANAGDGVISSLKKLRDVIKVVEYVHDKRIARELAFIKMENSDFSLSREVVKSIHSFQTKIVSMTDKDMIIEVVENENKVDSLLQLLGQYRIKEVVRSGQIAISL
ncbi:acetolactate synthase small subunit [bacterium]|jgi:acetolactate synthase I/III small subunit|nr:acetolactate synthase small subunit [bacterium]